MQRILLIVNPNAGGAQGESAALEAKRGFEIEGKFEAVDIALTTRAGHAPEIVHDRGRDYDAIIGIGGDGTANEIARGLDRLKNDAPAFGIIPLGTANVLAMELGLGGLSPEQTARELATARVRAMPYAKATLCDPMGKTKTFPIIVNVGVGFDARVVHRVAAARRISQRRFSKNSYLPQGIKELLSWRAPQFQIQADGIQLTRDASAFTACNTKNYGGVMSLTPQADLFARGMDLCIRYGSGRSAIVRHLAAARRGRQDREPFAEYRRVQSFEVHSDQAEPVQIDGDDLGFTPLTMKMAEHDLKLLVPGATP